MNKINEKEEFKNIINELFETFEAKNNDYGSSFSKTYEDFGLISAITRISDKHNRIVNLVKNNNIQVKTETIEDTLKDLANYAILTLIEIKKDKLEITYKSQKQIKNLAEQEEERTRI